MTFSEKLQQFFVTIGKNIGDSGIYILAIVLLVVTLAVVIALAYYSDEFKTGKSISSLNDYLMKNQYIDSENLVEFNRLMKKIPKPMREQWQRYMINRTDAPSKFINNKNCVEDVVKNGLFSNLVNSYYKLATYFFSALILLISVAKASQDNTTFGNTLWIAIGPCGLFLVLAVLAHILLKLFYNGMVNDMRYNIGYLETALDKAVVKMPEVVDYEIMFTKKEIRANIPALQEYYNQKAQYEQEELKQAKTREVEHEEYNFESLGIDGSLVMERAMKESEFYLGNRRRLMLEIDQIYSEKASVEKEFNDKYRSAQRKITEIKENLNRLKERLANTTQKIVSNDIRKQQADEIKKQQVIEKEIEEDEVKYNRDMERIEKEIAQRKEEIENGRVYVEKSLIQEFNEYNEKTRKALKEHVIATVEEEMNEMVQEIENLKQEIATKDLIISESSNINGDKISIIEQLNKQLQEKDNELKKIIANSNVIEKEIYK
ncbi:MAG: hypothetical protein IJW82_03415 [Clostridia bacterium]|nr:hypothetical protein [Clostridia bacterium]